MSLLIRIMAAVPKLAKQDCGGATEEPSCARCTNSPWEHWSWSLVLIVKFVCNLILWTCWIPERMLNQPAANRAGVIASPPSHDWFIPLNITCFPLACAGRHRVKESCTIVCPRAENPFSFFFNKKILKGNKLFHWLKGIHWTYRAFQYEKGWYGYYLFFNSLWICLQVSGAGSMGAF